METVELFTAALNLRTPWKVEEVEFREVEDKLMELHIHIGFVRGGSFSCPADGCKEELTAYDSTERTWRHLNFFQYKTYIHARQPRVKCPEHGVKTVDVPWARPGSGFTLLFESWCLELAKHVPVSVIADQVGEHDTRLWRFISYYVEKARKDEDYSGVDGIGIDETSKKGQNYITVAVDLKEKRVIFVTDGKDSGTVDAIASDFVAHKGNKDNIKVVTCDMSLGFKKGIEENFRNADTVIDKFHVIKHMNEAVDSTRKEEVKTNAELKNTKYIFLKNEENLTESQRARKKSLMKKHLKTGRAMMIREELQSVYEEASDRDDAEKRLKKLVGWISRCRIPHVKEFGRLLKNHWDDILNYFDYRLTNAILEGTNSVIQNIKRRSRGFRNTEYFITMIYLSCGKLPLRRYLVKV